MEKTNSKSKLRNIIYIVVSAVLMILAVTFLVIAISKTKQYNAAYDEWHYEWWELHTATLNDKPDATYFVWYVFAFVFFVVGGACLFSGLIPLIKSGGFKEVAEMVNEVKQNTAELKTVQEESKPKPVKCAACGAKLKKGSTICDYCGSDN